VTERRRRADQPDLHPARAVLSRFARHTERRLGARSP
jgi:hypothetical protein